MKKKTRMLSLRFLLSCMLFDLIKRLLPGNDYAISMGIHSVPVKLINKNIWEKNHDLKDSWSWIRPGKNHDMFHLSLFTDKEKYEQE